jgi:putative endopeptidase
MSHSGISPDQFDASVRPQDDLYRHVNGRWLDSVDIPADRAITGAFTALRDDSEAAVRRIIEDAAAAADRTAIEAKIGDLYASFMDVEAIDAAGAAPVAGALEAIFATASIEDLVAVMGALDRSGSSGLFGAMVTNDAGNPERSLLHLFQGGLGLPDESYYRQDGFAEIRGAYPRHVARMFTLAGVADPEAAAERVMALETAIAGCHWDTVTLRDPQKTYTLLTIEQALAQLPALGTWFAAAGVTADKTAELVFYTKDFFPGVARLLAEHSLRSWQDWLAMRHLNHCAPYLGAELVAADFDFYGTTLSGTPANKERWKRGVSLVEGCLGEAVGQVYVSRHFPQDHKERMDALVAGLVEAYRASISSLDWMGAETRAAALAKLDRFVPKIGYPKQWRDYSALEVDPADLLGNVARASEFELHYQLEKIGAPIDRDEWLMTPQTVNAYYNPRMNEIVFPAAILRPPFFDAGADDAVNYGGIGAVIGHEIGHGFDDQGSQFDGGGALRNWWTDEDRAAFARLTDALVAQYEVLSPDAAPGHFVNGRLTLGENIGDLGGLSIAYRAYLTSLDGAEPEVLDGLTGPQRFFAAWATVWRTKIRPEEAIRRLTVDPHSPSELRCNAVARNVDAFHEAFAGRPGDALWLDPADRVRIW